MTEIKRCGCGGEAKAVSTVLTAWMVMCEKCHTASWGHRAEAEAIETWNKAMSGKDINVLSKERKKDKWKEIHLTSRDYGKIYYQHNCCCDLCESPYRYCPNCGMEMERGEK